MDLLFLFFPAIKGPLQSTPLLVTEPAMFITLRAVLSPINYVSMQTKTNMFLKMLEFRPNCGLKGKETIDP